MKRHLDRVVSKRRNRIFGSLEARLSKRYAPYQFESLEGRSLLAADTVALLQNPANPLDVNADGQVHPLDALIVINDINSRGIRAVTLASDGPSLQPMAMTTASSANSSQHYVDTSGDNMVSPLDVLLVANALVEPDDRVRIRLVATDLAGNELPIVGGAATVATNSDFRIEVRATDVRQDPTGVFAAYIDAAITGQNGATGTLEPDAHPFYGDQFLNGQKFNFSDPDTLEETGSFSSFTSPTQVPDPTAEVLVFSFTVHAGNTPGSLTITPNAAEGDGNDVLLFGENTEVALANIAFEEATVTVTESTLPRVSVSPNITVTEGTGGTTNAIFTVSVSGTVTQTVTANFSTFAGTAQSTGAALIRDFTAQTGSVTFGPADTAPKFITVAVTADNLANEPNEVFHLDLTGVTNGLAADSHASATITADDPTPTLSIADVSVTEGNSGTTTAVFTVTMSSPSATEITVNFSTLGVTATAGSDFTATSGTLTFAANSANVTRTITVQVAGDTADEDNETFQVNLSGVSSGASIADGQGIGTINDDDGVVTPSFSISPATVTVTEGNAGQANAVFTVTLSSAATQAVSVVATTSNGTATAGTDYNATTQTLNFAIGDTSETFTVPVLGDTAIEANETFTVTLSNNSTGTTIGTATANGTITNDDLPTLVMPANVAVTETNGTTNALITVTLSSAALAPVTVNFTTSAGTATAGSDYTTTTGVLTFAAGDTSEVITVPILGDTISESNESFTVSLSSPVGANAPANNTTVTITDDDAPGFSVSPPTVTVTEGNTGTVNALFTVTLAGGAQQDTTVVFSTVNNSAVAGQDFTAVNQTLTFTPAASGPQVVTVQVTGDTTIEADETFNVLLSNASGSTPIVQNSAAAMILNDDLPTVSISPTQTSVLEGNSGITNVLLTLTLSAPNPQQVIVPYTLQGTTATGGTAAGTGIDFNSTAGAVTFAPNQTTAQITVPVFGDNLNETNELFNVNLGTPTNATVATGQGQSSVVITNDDPPSLSIADVTVSENGANALFTVTMSTPWTQDVTVQFATSNGSATAGNDFTTTTGTLTFAANTNTPQVITVPILQDTLSEGNENFTVTLSAPTGQATLADATATGTITDDDLPTITISSPTVTEGNSGTTAAVFTVTLSATPTQTVTVNFATSGVTATSGTDFTPANGVLTFTAGGPTTQNITVNVTGDTNVEPNETFSVTLTSPNGGVISGSGIGTGTITNDDLPVIAISSTSVVEGNSGTTNAVVTVTLSAASSGQVTVPIITTGGTATAGSDYNNLTNTTLTFAAGETSKQVTIQVIGDTTPEVNETFTVTTNAPTGATAPASPGVVTITNDDGPSFSVNDVTVTEGNAGTTNAIFTVTLGGDITSNATVVFTTQDGTATAGSDYVARTGTLTFTPTGAKTQTVSVTVNGDTVAEANETFNLNLSGASTGVLIADSQGVATITSDDQPTLTISDVTVTEGNSGTVNAVVTVTLNGATSGTVTVVAATANGTATAGSDYTALAGTTLTFAPGSGTTRTVTIAVNGDSLDEANETFSVNLSSASGATLTDSQGTVTITDDDPTPTLSISDVTVNEADAAVNAVFTVTLSAASGQPVTVQFATANSTAQQPFDYTSQTGTLTFAAGETSKTISISVRGDNTDEQNETFQVNLTNATSATLADAQGVGTIVDDDLPGEVGASSLSGKVFIDVNNSGTQDTGEQALSGVTVQLADSSGTNIIRTTTTDSDGNYFFLDLAPGNYTIIQQQPASMSDGMEIVGTQGGSSTTNDRITVALNESVDGSGNNFAERGLRSDLISKRMFLASNTSTNTTLQALNLREGSVWMPFDAGIDGTLTAQATGAAGQGLPGMTLYDNNLRPLASSTGSGTTSRLDYQGQPGQPYFLAVSGANSDVDVDISNLVKQVGSTVTVTGTGGNDTFEFMAGSSYTVIINGVNYTFSPTKVNSIVFNGNGGSDTAIVNGSAAAETANLTLGSGTVSGSGYSVNLSGVNNIVVNGNGGNDVATLADSAFSDELDADGDWIGMSNDLSFATSLHGYKRVTATASHGGSDTAHVGAIDFVLEKSGWQNN